MAFVQIIEYKTTRQDEITQLLDEWLAATAGKRTATRGLICADRDRADTYVEIIQFPSYEEAMRNSELPETSAAAEKFAKLCDEGPTFRNLDVVREDDEL